MGIRVAVIDDDEIARCGTAAILDRHPDIEVVFSASHGDATGPWDDVDVAVVDASDHRCRDDQFPGVGVVEAIRRTGPPRCTVIVITGVLHDDAVRRRMREAGADAYYHRSEVLDAATLTDAVLGIGERNPVPEPADPEALHRLGITPTTQVNAAIVSAHETGLISGEPDIGARGRSRTRRRRVFNTKARLATVTASGRPPEHHQDAPSLQQIDRFLRWATRMRNP